MPIAPKTRRPAPAAFPSHIDVHVDIHVHGDAGGQQSALAQILAGITQLLTKVGTMAGELDKLTTEVSESRTVMASALALINGLAQKLRDAIAQNDPAALTALADSLDQGSNELAAAVAANTPADTGGGDTGGDATRASTKRA